MSETEEMDRISEKLLTQKLKDPLDYIKAQAVVSGIFLLVLFIVFLVVIASVYISSGSVGVLIAGIVIVTLVLFFLLCCHGCMYRGIAKRLRFVE